MAVSFRFSPRPNRAAEIRWRAWGVETFDDAIRADRPILLNLTAVWCEWCQRMDETTYSDPELIELINRELVPLRVDADQYPHVQERYLAGGWPTNAFLTPTGEVLWAGPYLEAAEFGAVIRGVLAAWRDRREELQLEIERRRRALEAARGRKPVAGLVRREAADDVVTALIDGFDPRNGGFGTAPKFPLPHAIELMLLHTIRDGDERSRVMAEQTLDGMLAGELFDTEEGGFFRYALAPDWTEPRREKLLGVNAGLVRVFGLGAEALDRGDLAEVVDRTVSWIDTRLALPSGLWGGSLAADTSYYELSAAGRGARREAPPVDQVVYTDTNAAWIRALAEAGGRLGRPEWIERARGALDVVLSTMAASDGLLYHFQGPAGPPEVPGLLTDLVEVARACQTVARATGEESYSRRARALARAMESALWAEDGGFLDHRPTGESPGALRYRERPFELNAAAARLHLELLATTGERGYRAVAERILALLSPSAGRYGYAGAEFALAVEEYFEPPPRTAVSGPVVAGRLSAGRRTIR